MRYLATLLTLSVVSIAAAATTLRLTPEQQAVVALYSQPDSVFEQRLEGWPDVIDGQKLHPKLQYELQDDREKNAYKRRQKLKEMLLAGGDRLAKLRRSIDVSWDFRTKRTAPMKRVEDREIFGLDDNFIPVRIYVPDVDNGGRALPVLVYFHGGGFLFASIDAMDGAVRLIANEARVVVVSVGYRLSPEHVFPAFNRDAIAAYEWVIVHIADYGGDPSRVGIGGDSAGGYLAAATTIHEIDSGGPVPAAQLMYYPAVDLNATRYPSYRLFGEGFGLDQYFIDVVMQLAFPEPVRADPRLYPINYRDYSVMPPAVVASAGFDPLRDQAKAYAQRINEAGGTAFYINYPSLIHSFLESSGTVDDVAEAAGETARLFGRVIRELPDRRRSTPSDQ